MRSGQKHKLVVAPIYSNILKESKTVLVDICTVRRKCVSEREKEKLNLCTEYADCRWARLCHEFHVLKNRMKMIELVVLQPFQGKDDSRTCESTASTHTRTDV